MQNCYQESKLHIVINRKYQWDPCNQTYTHQCKLTNLLVRADGDDIQIWKDAAKVTGKLFSQPQGSLYSRDQQIHRVYSCVQSNVCGVYKAVRNDGEGDED